MSGRLILRGGCLLTLDAKVGNHTRADLLIEDGRIVEIGDGVRARDAEVIDASDTIVMPGFVDTHRHAWKSLFRNSGTSEPPGNSASTTDSPPRYEPDDVYAATLIGLLGAVEAGISTIVDWSDISTSAAHRDAALEAHRDSGLRTVLVQPVDQSAEEPDGSMFRPETGDSKDSSSTMAFGSSDLRRSNLDRVAEEWALARRLGLRIHAHAGLDVADRGAVAALPKGRLGDDLTLVHCSRLDDADLDAVASSSAAVSLSPSAEMAGQLGQPPIQQLLDRKIKLGLGVDNEHLAPGDMFAQMRSAISLQHATYFDLKLAGRAGLPNLLTTRELIRFATLDGAHVVGLGDTTGSLTPGKRADIIVLRTDRPNIYPINDPIGAVVWGMDTSNIDWVFVGGRTLVRNGVLEADLDRARSLAVTAQARVLASSGVAAGTDGAQLP